MTQSTNPLLDIQFQIPFDRLRPEHAQPAIDTLLDQSRAALGALAGAGERDFAGFVDELDRLTRELDTARTVVGHMDSVVATDEWRAAEEAILPGVTEFYTSLGLDAGLWQALKAYAQTPAAQHLDPVRARFLKLTMDEFRRGGADLPKDKKARLQELNAELAQVTNTFAKNVLDATAAFELYVPAERLSGVPQRVQEATRADAEERGQAGHRLTLHAPVLTPVLTYADDRELRRELWQASGLVGQQPEGDNRPLVRRILELRREKAQLLGYRNFADLVLEDRMAKTGDAALAFERDLEAKTRPAWERENAELEAFYRQQAGTDAPALAHWDIAYWAEKQRQEQYDYDEEELRPYFELNSVLAGLFEIVGRVFGITVKEAQAPGWHPDVRYYDIFAEGKDGQRGEHIASFYTDWFPRDTKRGGAWMNAFVTGGPAEGQFLPHLGLMCGNMTPPGKDTPALLSLDEVETVFHEFGHLLHHALSRVEVRSLSGTNVAWDFVELPSQIMENWVWQREALDLFARHYQTGERLPEDLFRKMLAARNYRAASAAMRQYSFGMTDLSLHVEYDPASDTDPVAYAREVMNRFSPLPLPGDYAMVARFGHLFASPVGYGAGYYSYKWAEVLDADAFSRFEQEGIFSRETGRDFVDTLLGQGGSKDPAELYRDFMGRDPDPQALLRRSGLL
ncbi:oligopeptidase A [Deinococcus piscis]|uniref:oligopeptidase A n=1 Tax=Deinococcus piscis TaxID=394230 RepID=A0ABQ3K8M2_9DEIO|nr:M3 family metallopeptidase [Deinococcus piscis]GHG06972.1 oligopeptidase A [Deinococcus piscis]